MVEVRGQTHAPVNFKSPKKARKLQWPAGETQHDKEENVCRTAESPDGDTKRWVDELKNEEAPQEISLETFNPTEKQTDVQNCWKCDLLEIKLKTCPTWSPYVTY